MTGEPFSMAAAADRSSETSERSDERPPRQGLLSPSSPSSQWPTLGHAAFHGIAGRVVRTLEPHTEADPSGLLLTFLAAAGNIIGPGPHAIADAASHPARLNVVLVGQTSRARKGSAWAQIRRLLNQVDPTWTTECILPGLASGEALIAEVRDAAGDDLGASDKRRLVLEPEFARLLAVASREGAILSAVIREAWDGNQLKNRTKRDPLVATGAHISVVGHVTREELLRRLADTEAANGFANRFLFALVRRSQHLPEGGNLDQAALDDLALQVQTTIQGARRVRVLQRDPGARERWAMAYKQFGDGGDGLAGAVTARPEAQTLRLSVAYAALDGSATIQTAHLRLPWPCGPTARPAPTPSSAMPWATRSPTGSWSSSARPAPKGWTAPHSPACSVATSAPSGSTRPGRSWSAVAWLSASKRRLAAGLGSCPGRCLGSDDRHHKGGQREYLGQRDLRLRGVWQPLYNLGLWPAQPGARPGHERQGRSTPVHHGHPLQR
jgi:hypothetical protein